LSGEYLPQDPALSAGNADSLRAALRRHDPDRYLTLLFAPADRRTALTALYAFNFEIAKIREVVHEPLIGRIRLQWWREAIDEIYRDAAPRRHEVVEPLAEAIKRFELTRYHFDRLIDSREADLDPEPPGSLAALETYAEESSGRLVLLALEILGARDAASQEAGRHVGIAWALTGLLRALPTHLRLRHAVLPADEVAAAGLDTAATLALAATPALAAISKRIADRARHHLSAACSGKLPRTAIPALLPAALARPHLRRLARVGHNPLDPALALPDGMASWRLAAAAVFGRI
jgi:NADH dehydrogenase [ubiquinone] 1 alpha subcomplex assembly factor 6